MKLSLTFLAVFAGVVVADMHATCACNNGGYNWRITTAACDAVGIDKAEYKSSEGGRCVSHSGKALDGDQWQGHCRTVAKVGFACADGKGTCYADTNAVKGDCD